MRGTKAHWCASAWRSLSVLLLCEFGISTCSPLVAVARWCSREVRVRLDRDFCPGGPCNRPSSTRPRRDHPVYSRNFPFAWSRLWGLARWGHDPSVTGRSARHQNSLVGCGLCHADDSSFIHHLVPVPHPRSRRVGAVVWPPSQRGFRLGFPCLFKPSACGQHPANSEGSRPVRRASVQPVAW